MASRKPASRAKYEKDDSEDDLTVGSEDEDSDDGAAAGGETGLTQNQSRLLYLVSLYTRPARSALEKEEWVRRQALMVIIYECIVAQVLDYDYAPASDMVENRRKYFNISQEGRSDVDFLREEELINGLKLSSKHYYPVTCYQISEKGLEMVKRVLRADKDAVHDLVYAPGTRELLQVVWRGEEFFLVGPNGFERQSSVTDCEDVSYVSSAYLPQCLRFGGRPTLSNAHRSSECGASAANIRDELDEVLTLNSVSIIVTEFIPFGANQIAQMNSNLGSSDRVQGGYFTALIDGESSGTKFAVEPGLTTVKVLDFTATKHVNFEADIHLPEDEGIVQVETFGVSMNQDGTVYYGMQVEAVMDRIKDNISLDHLSRLLVDVHIDSSTIVDSTLSAYQRRLISLVYNGDAESRDKMNLIVANEITPHLTAEEYLDKGEYENELKQILGDTRAAFDISEHDTLVFGANGLLIAGPNSRHHEPLLCSYMQFMAMDLFVRNFFNRTFVLVDQLKELRVMVQTCEESPQSLVNVRRRHHELSEDTALLAECLAYLAEALETAEVVPEPADQNGRALFERLQILDHAEQLSRRVLDLKKNLGGSKAELKMLYRMIQEFSDTRDHKLTESVAVNTKNALLANEASERSSRALELIVLILVGSLAFDILQRLTGDWSVVDKASAVSWASSFAQPLIFDTAFMWFAFNMLLWLVLGFASMRLLKRMGYMAKGVLVLRMKAFAKLNMSKWNRYLRTKTTAAEDRNYESINHIVKLDWYETDLKRWGGCGPHVTVEYDESTGHLLWITVRYNKREASKGGVLTAFDLRNKIALELQEAAVFTDGFTLSTLPSIVK